MSRMEYSLIILLKYIVQKMISRIVHEHAHHSQWNNVLTEFFHELNYRTIWVQFLKWRQSNELTLCWFFFFSLRIISFFQAYFSIVLNLNFIILRLRFKVFLLKIHLKLRIELIHFYYRGILRNYLH